MYFFLREKAVEKEKVGTQFKLLYRQAVDFFQFILVYLFCIFFFIFHWVKMIHVVFSSKYCKNSCISHTRR